MPHSPTPTIRVTPLGPRSIAQSVPVRMRGIPSILTSGCGSHFGLKKTRHCNPDVYPLHVGSTCRWLSASLWQKNSCCRTGAQGLSQCSAQPKEESGCSRQQSNTWAGGLFVIKIPHGGDDNSNILVRIIRFRFQHQDPLCQRLPA